MNNILMLRVNSLCTVPVVFLVAIFVIVRQQCPRQMCVCDMCAFVCNCVCVFCDSFFKIPSSVPVECVCGTCVYTVHTVSVFMCMCVCVCVLPVCLLNM